MIEKLYVSKPRFLVDVVAHAWAILSYLKTFGVPSLGKRALRVAAQDPQFKRGLVTYFTCDIINIKHKFSLSRGKKNGNGLSHKKNKSRDKGRIFKLAQDAQ